MSNPYVASDRRGTRYLELLEDRSFSLSSMPLADPFALVAPYMIEMMKCLVLAPELFVVLLLGVGAGSQVKWLLRRFAQVHVTGVERDPNVLDMAHAHFHLPRPGPRLALVVDDALRHVATAAGAAVDVLLVDLCTPRLPEGAASPGFLTAARARLRPGGVFCANHYAQPPEALAAQRAALAQAFGWVHATRVAPDNVVFFALPWGLPDRAILAARAEALEPTCRLGLPAFVAALPRG